MTEFYLFTGTIKCLKLVRDRYGVLRYYCNLNDKMLIFHKDMLRRDIKNDDVVFVKCTRIQNNTFLVLKMFKIE
ncbi:hypothetical protein CIG2463D_0940 [Campylobacter iguaniorum]|uniref:Uncharacterized protein n=1 Tax=Campylobacter iguaniorum TaxID=1244531 RepID=A0A076FAR3_9BACT|nr:hypothetical protein CIG1485E_0940 [Campylobacter iguaniorum]ALV24513.1 hypothetical protein CIG2463D_0940 [Campylobacter iguaniorum]